jgi:hypothetical protein
MNTKNISAVIICAALLATPVLPQGFITPLFPIKDGCVSPDSCSGDRKELAADETRQSCGWMVFRSASVNYRNIGSAMLAICIKSVSKPGLCGVHALMSRITAPENSVRVSDVKFDDMPIAAQQLDSSFTDQMILVNITELVQSKTFYGVALRPLRGLSAQFSSREGFPPPAILVTRDTLNPNPPKWWSAPEAPDTSVGKTGDFYVCPLTGIIYRKSSVAWDSVASLVIPPEQPASPAAGRRIIHRPLKRRY